MTVKSCIAITVTANGVLLLSVLFFILSCSQYKLILGFYVLFPERHPAAFFSRSTLRSKCLVRSLSTQVSTGPHGSAPNIHCKSNCTCWPLWSELQLAPLTPLLFLLLLLNGSQQRWRSPKKTVKITGKKLCSSPINSIANFQFITVVLLLLQGYPEFNFLTSEPTLREIYVPKSKCLSIKQPM